MNGLDMSVYVKATRGWVDLTFVTVIQNAQKQQVNLCVSVTVQ